MRARRRWRYGERGGGRERDGGSGARASALSRVPPEKHPAHAAFSTRLHTHTHTFQVRLTDSGADLIEVSDNGRGIPPSQHASLGRKHHTSKLRTFADLGRVETFGFRGEALSSLCGLAESVCIVTRPAEGEDGQPPPSAATRLTFDAGGALVGSEPAARAHGTTVAVKGLFAPLPVRRRELGRTLRREYGRALTILQAYALACPGVRLVATNAGAGPGGGRTTAVASAAGASQLAVFASLFGPKAAATLVPVDIPLPTDLVPHGGSGEAAAGDGGAPPPPPPRIAGFVSSGTADRARAAGDRQFFFINGRPVDFPAASRALNEAYRSLASPATAACRPSALLDFHLPREAADVNVTPDKRRVFLAAEGRVLAALAAGLAELWEPSRSTYTLQTALTQQAPAKRARVAVEEGGAGEVEEEGEREGAEAGARPAAAAPPASPSPSSSKEEEEEEEEAVPSPSIALGPRPTRRSTVLCSPAPAAVGGRRGRAPPAAALSPAPATPPAAAAAPPLSLAAFALGGAKPPGPVPPPRRLGRATTPPPLSPARRGRRATVVVAVAKPAEEEDEEEEAAAEPSSSEEEVDEMEVEMVDAPPAAVSPPAESSEEEEEEEKAAHAMGEEQETAAEEAEVEVEVEAEVDPAAPQPAPPPLTVRVDLAALTARFEARWAARTAASRSSEAGEGEGEVAPPPPAFHAASLAGKATSEDEAAGGAPPQPPPASDALLPAPADPTDAAASELERVFARSEFKALAEGVVGQFNLGFILAAAPQKAKSKRAQCDARRAGRDLFIIDQHASDEKANFERLASETVFGRQPLLAPVPLDLAPAEALAVRAHADAFAANGFEIVDEEDGGKTSVDGDASAPASGRLLLTAVPTSRGVVFGEADVQELAAELAARPAARTDGAAWPPRPARLRALLASRACRSSVMIGRHLALADQKRIVARLASLDSPWNCPHGRPTMRHLAVLPPAVEDEEF